MRDMLSARIHLICSLTLVVGVCAPITLLGEGGGTHARTTTRLLDAFEELRDNQSAADQSAGDKDGASGTLVATFGSGCFWCTEAVFEPVKGVTKVTSGYSGGYLPNPTYEQVCTKATGHAEVVQVEYDPKLVSYAKLLEVFWFTHDPTTLNQQGPDKGPQYRSVVFYHSDEQRELAERYKRKLDESMAYRSPIVTEITKFTAFYPAENYHQDYFALNGRMPYCRQLIRPKVQKFRKVFQDDLKTADDRKPAELD